MKRPTWTARDGAAMEAQGWAVYNEDSNPEIQRDDERKVFPHDEAALAFVRRRARKGCRTARKALRACGLLP